MEAFGKVIKTQKSKYRGGALCEFPKCQSRASYGDELKKYRWCTLHRLPGSKSFQKKICEHEECNKHASYGDSIARTKRWCKAHKLNGAILITSAQCEHEGCTKQPCFGFPNDKKRWCNAHKEPESVNLSRLNAKKRKLQHSDLITSESNELDKSDFSRRSKKSIIELVLFLEKENFQLREEIKTLRETMSLSSLREYDSMKRKDSMQDKKEHSDVENSTTNNADVIPIDIHAQQSTTLHEDFDPFQLDG